MRSVYILMTCIIVCSVAVLVTAHSEKVRGLRIVIRDLSVLVLAAFTVISPYPLAEIFRSGFVSLFVGIGFLTASLAFIIPEIIVRRDVAVFAVISIVATLSSYQLISLLVIPIASVLLVQFVWKSISRKSTKVVIMGFLALFSLGAALQMSSIADQFSRRVNDGGAIRTTNIVGVVVVFLLALALSGVVHGRARYIFVSTSAVTGSALVTLQLIAWARSDTTDRYGYYGQKLMFCYRW